MRNLNHAESAKKITNNIYDLAIDAESECYSDDIERK